MAKIKTDETHLDHPIKIKRRRFNGLLITRVTWYHVSGPSEIKRPRLNESQPCVSSEPLI